MKQLTLKQGLNTFNLFFITTFLVLALYSAIGQQVFPFIGQYRMDIEHYISKQLAADVNIRTLSGDMDILTPSIHMEGVTMSASEDQSIPSLSIAAIDAILDPQASLFNLAPVFKSVRISGLSININDDSDSKRDVNKDNSYVIQTFIEILLLQHHLELNNVTVEFTQGDSVERLHLNNLSMTGDGYNRLMTGSITFGSDKKIKAGLRLYSEGSPYDLEDFYARGVLDLPKIDVDYWLEKTIDVSLFDAFSASSQLSVEFKEGLLNYAKLNLASRQVAIPDVKPLKNINTELWLKQNNADTWSIWLQQAGFTIDQKKWSLEDLALKLSRTSKGNRWHGFVKDSNINETYELIDSLELMPETISEVFNDLSPSGNLKNFNVIIQQAEDDNTETSFTLAGELEGVSTKSHNSIPSLKNVSGVIAASKDNGRVQFEGADMELGFPEIYHNPFKILQGKGQVDWKLNDEGFQVVGNGIEFELAGVQSLRGGFDLVAPKKETGKTGSFELNLSASETDVTAHPILIPKNIPSALNNWLTQALNAGKINTGQLYFYDSIGAGQSDPVMELYLDAKDAQLTYLNEWPSINNISGQVFVDNTDVYGRFNSAVSLGGQLSSAQLVYHNEPEPYLWVSTEVSGASSEMFSYFKTTPLKELVGDVFANWDLTGAQTTTLGLKIPLDDDVNNIKVAVSSQLSNSSLLMNDINLSIANINGPIQYQTSTGLTSPGLSAQLWNEKIDSSIKTKMHGKDKEVDIQFSGLLDTRPLKDWLKLSMLEPISGETDVQGSFIIDTRKQKFTGLKFQTEAQGILVKLADGFGKSASESLSVSGSLNLVDGQVFKLSYGDKASLAMKLDKGTLYSGQVFLGKTEAYVPSEAGMVVDGHVAAFHMNDWIKIWDDINHSKYASTNGTSSNPVRLLNVSADLFKYNEFEFEQVNSIIKQVNDVWTFSIDAPVAKGMITLDQTKPLNVDLEYLHWPIIIAKDEMKVESDLLVDVDPNVFPEMALNVDEIFLGPRNLGRWKLNVTPVENGVNFSKIDGLIKKLNVKGDLQWVKKQDNKDKSIQQMTHASLLLTSNDVGGIQKAWRMKPAVEAKYGKINTDISWQGSPASPDFPSMNGKLSLYMKDGRFIEAGDAGSLSAFGLLNFSAIGRRLRLDFSDVYESGFHFDSVKGRTDINNGIIKVIDTLEIDGPSAKFASSGTVNLNTKELNQELSATFPVTSTLPLMAIIAGFAPPVAASLFVGERLVGEEIEKFTSATYKLTGTWDAPNLNLMKRFDNDIEGKQNKSFWHRMKDFFGVGEE